MSAAVAGMGPIRMRQHGAEGIVDNAIWTANVGTLEVSHQRESVARWSPQVLVLASAKMCRAIGQVAACCSESLVGGMSERP